MLHNIQRIHFVGIGGAGMSAIAKVLLAKGFAVSGSDIAKSETVHRLQQLGATIFVGHDAPRSPPPGTRAYPSSTAPIWSPPSCPNGAA